MFKILILDDDANLRRMFGKALFKQGYEVYAASTLKQARQLLDQHCFDVFVCDLLIGDEMGVDVVREYHKQLRDQRVLVIALSADERYFDACRSLGVQSIVSKPVMPNSLVNIVQQVIDENRTDAAAAC